MVPLEVQGISMAPWILPKEVVWIDETAPSQEVRLGDVVVFRNVKTNAAIAHRVISKNPLKIKGDRNPSIDLLGEDWKYEGRAEKIYRNGKWIPIRRGLLLALMSKYGLYPGQKF